MRKLIWPKIALAGFVCSLVTTVSCTIAAESNVIEQTTLHAENALDEIMRQIPALTAHADDIIRSSATKTRETTNQGSTATSEALSIAEDACRSTSIQAGLAVNCPSSDATEDDH